jgi:Ca2+-transporting ATPase
MTDAWHALDIESVIDRLGSSMQGLDTASARSRLLKDGLNRLPRKRAIPKWLRFFHQLTSPIILILGAAATVKFFMGLVHDAMAIFVVLLFNAVLGFFQEQKADASLESLRKMSAVRAKVVRRGVLEEIDAEKVVKGDVLFLESGTRVCADARLIETHALDVDESMLTGESAVVRKNASVMLDEHTPLADQVTMVFANTIVTRGRGKAIVIATGAHTEVAAIAREVESVTPPPSPLERRLKSFGHSVVLVTLVLVASILLFGHYRGYDLSDLVMTCVSLTVSAVPEGLPIAITIVLSRGLFMMAKRMAVIRKLDAVEALGCTTVICTDKTGTLTENEMTVGKTFLGVEEGLVWAARIAYFCSEGRLDGQRAIGDPVDTALMRFAVETGVLDTAGWQKELILPFESEQQMMACSLAKDGQRYTLWKGSVDALRPKCRRMWYGNTIVPIDPSHIDVVAHDMAKEGFKVLCLAYGEGESEELTLAGIVGLFDPPREEVREAVATCQRAGIRIVMITGDDPLTAKTIAHDVGLDSSGVLVSTVGTELDTMSDAQLHDAVEHSTIFARVTPHHKLRIVQQLQAHGEVVAMTGDGVNDAPPLRQADIGIAMGTGTDVAKEASTMVVINNSFAAIVEAIRQGRVIFRSLQQMVVYLLTTSFGGVMTLATSVVLALPLPMLPLHLLWVNLVTDGTTTIPLSLEGEHGNIMKAPPRPTSAPFISAHMFFRSLLASLVMMVGTTGIFMWVLNVRHESIDYARTMAFTTLALFQMANALNSRSFRRSLLFTYHSSIKGQLHCIPFFLNRWLLCTLVCCFILQVLAVELPLLQDILLTTPLLWMDWFCILGVAALVIVVVEINKAVWFFFTPPQHHL